MLEIWHLIHRYLFQLVSLMGALIPCLLFFLLLDIFQVISFLVSSLLVGILFSIGVLSHFMCWCVFGINHLLLLVPSQSCVDLDFDIIWTTISCHTLVCSLCFCPNCISFGSRKSLHACLLIYIVIACLSFLIQYIGYTPPNPKSAKMCMK